MYSVVSRGRAIRGSKHGADRRAFPSPNRPERLWDPPSPLFERYGCSFPGVKRPVRIVYCLIPCSAEIKNEWNYTSTFTACLPGVDKDSFSFVSYLIA